MILFSCRRVSEVSSKELDARLRVTERVSAAAHRLMCGPCARYRAQLHAVERAVGEFVRAAPDVGDARLPPEVKARVRARLTAERGADGTTTTDTSPPGDP